MEEVAVLPMVPAAAVLDNNGDDDAVSSTAIIPSVTMSVEEKEHINGDIPTTITSASNDDEELFTTPVCRTPSTHKKRGAFGLFRAMFLSFGRSDSIKKTDGGGGDTTSPKRRAIAASADKPAGEESPSWKSIMDGMRPLRLRGQELEYYYPPPPPPLMGHGADVYHDVILSPPSPARSGFELEEVGMTSRYASAEDLHQMDTADDEEDTLAAEGGHDDGDSSCPHAIDMQAEEFIAKFYEQFKSESFDGRASE